MTNFKSEVTTILQTNPEYTRELIILLGVVKLCEVMDVKSLETIVKSYDIKSNEWWPLIHEITEDEYWEEILEGELYQAVLNLQLWLSNHQHDIREGSPLWFLMQKRNKE